MQSHHKHIPASLVQIPFYGVLKRQCFQAPLVGSTSDCLFTHLLALFPFVLRFSSPHLTCCFFICSLFFLFSHFVSLTDVSVFSLFFWLFCNHFYDLNFDTVMWLLFFTYIWPKSDICSISFGCVTEFRHTASKLFTLAVRHVTAVFLSNLPTEHC